MEHPRKDQYRQITYGLNASLKRFPQPIEKLKKYPLSLVLIVYLLIGD